MVTRDFLSAVDLFAALAPEDALALANLAREETVPKGRVIFRERDPGDRVFVVVSGVVEISITGHAGARPVTLARLERGEILGEMAVIDGGPRSATASAAVVPETRLVSWDAEDFHAFLASRPQASRLILQGILKKISRRLRQTSEAVHTLLRAIESA